MEGWAGARTEVLPETDSQTPPCTLRSLISPTAGFHDRCSLTLPLPWSSHLRTVISDPLATKMASSDAATAVGWDERCGK